MRIARGGLPRSSGSSYPLQARRSLRCGRLQHVYSSKPLRARQGIQRTSNFSGPPTRLHSTREAEDGARHRVPASLVDALREEEMEMNDTNRSTFGPSPRTNYQEHPEDLLRPSEAERGDVDAWMAVLDNFLPENLQTTTVGVGHGGRLHQPSCASILRVLRSARARSKAGVDLLSYMCIKRGHWKSAAWLINTLLKPVATQVSARSAATLPSNIAWPSDTLLDQTFLKPVMLDKLTHPDHQKSALWHRDQIDPRYASSMSEHKDATMSQIWYTLGNLIIESAEMPEDQAKDVMSFVYRIIGQVHNSDLVPESVYSYAPPNHTSAVQRPPILHLLASRMLSTLSDAVWRAHQDELIEQAVSRGAQYEELGVDPPGGRFRLKVRPLGPEVWLEFVLWCCVDGGFANTGSRIIELLHRQTSDPWSAVNWTSANIALESQATIDEDRLRVRHGGNVGQKEGYSSERPSAEMKRRTISTEVVLALVESLCASVNVGLIDRGTPFLRTQRIVKSLIAFLEPHCLSAEYFDFLTVRVAQSGGFNMEQQPDHLLAWTNTMAFLRSLKTTATATQTSPTLDFDSINLFSELHPGILHQALEALVHIGDVRRALDVFTTIQQMVDDSKLESISAFLSAPAPPEEPSLSMAASSSPLDFIQSHGQLPYYKLAAFLNLVTDSKLERLGNWLLYSEDIDGPRIPQNVYRQSCLALPLARFAALSNDNLLLERLMVDQQESWLKASVSLSRTFVNANFAFYNFIEAEQILIDLSNAKAGGYSPSNLAHLGCALLYLESDTHGLDGQTASGKIDEAMKLAELILSGNFEPTRGDFFLEQRGQFRCQIGCLLRTFNSIPNTRLSALAKKWQDKYESGNDITLPTSTFNTLLSAVVETKGAKRGQMMWEFFCEDPRARLVPETNYLPQDLLIPQSVEIEESDWDEGYAVPARHETDESSVPFVNIAAADVDTEEVSTKSDSDVLTAEAISEGLLAPPQAEGVSFSTSTFQSLIPERVSKPQSRKPRPPTFTPLVRPDLRTLRLIVRGALSEQRLLRAQSPPIDTSEQQQILRWATRFYRAFGSHAAIIEQEIQQEYKGEESNSMSPAEATAAYDAYRALKSQRELPPINVRRHFVHGRTMTAMPAKIELAARKGITGLVRKVKAYGGPTKAAGGDGRKDESA